MRLIFVCLFSLASFIACAAEAPRKIDFTVVLLDQDSNPMKECVEIVERECKRTQDVTLGLVAFRGLATPEQGLSQEDSFKRGMLGLNVNKSPGAELTAEEIALIKKQIVKAWGPLVVARAFVLLDPAAK